MDIEKKYAVQWVLVAILLLLFFLQGVCSAVNSGMTSDEYVHISAGASYIAARDFRMNTEHPPLTKSLAGAAVVLAGAKVPLDSPSWQNKWQVTFASDFWQANSENRRNLLLVARVTLLAFSSVLGIFVFLFAREIYNAKAGLLAAFIFAFEPNLIAHASLANSDVPIAMTALATLYFAFRFLKTLQTRHFVGLLVFFGLAVVTKYSGLMLFPVVLIMYWYFLRNFPTQFHLPQHILGIKLPSKVGFARNFVFVASVTFWFAVALVISIIAAYSFKLTVISPENSPQFVDLAEQTIPDFLPGKDALIELSQKLPLPKEYMMGLYQVYVHNKIGHPAYLMGKFSNMGWWYYFPVVFFFKTPIALTALLLLPIVFAYRKDREVWIAEAAVVIPILAYAVPAIFSHINIGVRHLFFVFPLIIVYSAGVMSLTFRSSKRGADAFDDGARRHRLDAGGVKLLAFRSLIGGLCLYLVASNLANAPNHLSYANELAGDARQRAWIMNDSNLDWGQGLLPLKRFMDKHGIESVHLYYGIIDDPAVYGLNCIREDPATIDVDAFEPGETYAVSLWAVAGYGLTYEMLNDEAAAKARTERYASFIDHEPDAVVGGCMWVFTP